MKLECRNCKRFLGECEAFVGELPCPTCKATTQFKRLPSDLNGLLRYKFVTPEKEPKKKPAVDTSTT